MLYPNSIDDLDRIREKYDLTLFEFYATIEIYDKNNKLVVACSKSDGWTIGELREHLTRKINELGYIL